VLSFNYLPEPAKLRDVIGRRPVPIALRVPLQILGCCLLFAVFTWLLESLRADRVQRIRQAAAAEYAAQSTAMANANVYARRVAMLQSLDSEVRRAAESGTSAAQKLSSVARDLPADAWLTAITPDARGLVLEGMAANLDTVRRALVSFSRDAGAGEPELVRSEIAQTSAGTPLVRFSMHLSIGVR
jgi:Tfp pilus assembly protein PilN